MTNHNSSGSRPSMWAVAAVFGSTAFLLASLVLAIGDYRPF